VLVGSRQLRQDADVIRADKPSRLTRLRRWLLRFLAAVVAAAVLGSLAHSQLSLAALGAHGIKVPLATRLQTSAADLIHFAPTWALIVALGFALAFGVTALLVRRWPRHRTWLCVLAGFCAIATALWLMQLSLGLTAVAAARTPLGFALLCAGGALGGWVYARLDAGESRVQ